MINHLFLYKGWGSLLILSFTSSTDKWNAALVILAIALFSRSWFSLFRILPQTASWYKPVPLIQKALFGAGTELLLLRHLKKLEQAPGDACCPMRKSGEIMVGKAIKRVP